MNGEPYSLLRVSLAAARREAIPRFNAARWSLGTKEAAARTSRFFLGYQCGPAKGLLLGAAEALARAAILVSLIIRGRQSGVSLRNGTSWLYSDARQLRCRPAGCQGHSLKIGTASYWRKGGLHLFHLADRKAAWRAWLLAWRCWPAVRLARRRMKRRSFAGQVCCRMSDGSFLALWELALASRLLTGAGTLHYAGHFDRWVDLLSELRRRGCIQSLEFHQHGALEEPEAGIANVRPVFADRFTAMFAESRFYLRRHWLMPDRAVIEVANATALPAWQPWKGKRAAAIILQDPRIPGEMALIRWFVDFCAVNDLEALAYLHPRFGGLTGALLAREFPGLHICPKERHRGLAFYCTRFSTLGVELAREGEKVAFAGWLGRICVFSSGAFCVAGDEPALTRQCRSFIQ